MSSAPDFASDASSASIRWRAVDDLAPRLLLLPGAELLAFDELHHDRGVRPSRITS